MELLFLTLTIIFWGIAPIFEKLALSKGEPFIGMVLRSFVVVVILFFTMVSTGKTKQLFSLDYKTAIYFSLSGIFGALLGTFMYFKALKFSDASKIVPISAAFPLLTLILSVIFLKEDVTIIRIFGAILIVLGIYFVK